MGIVWEDLAYTMALVELHISSKRMGLGPQRASLPLVRLVIE